jgi:hypothetical protein
LRGFKVEVVEALGNRVTKILNDGADLQLAAGTFIELKGATVSPILLA